MCKTKIGKELFGGPMDEVLEEIVASMASRFAREYFARVTTVNKAEMDAAISAANDSICALASIETLRDERQV